eukprot:GHUV01021760.1.p2 GENE.GHUV01021760.1~~GHUV01021760.1.p2  ORF type:complete len:111 (+),score=14.14 GHUV01021760.1:2437-2769(+)
MLSRYQSYACRIPGLMLLAAQSSRTCWWHAKLMCVGLPVLNSSLCSHWLAYHACRPIRVVTTCKPACKRWVHFSKAHLPPLQTVLMVDCVGAWWGNWYLNRSGVWFDESN